MDIDVHEASSEGYLLERISAAINRMREETCSLLIGVIDMFQY